MNDYPKKIYKDIYGCNITQPTNITVENWFFSNKNRYSDTGDKKGHAEGTIIEKNSIDDIRYAVAWKAGDLKGELKDGHPQIIGNMGTDRDLGFQIKNNCR